MQGRRGAHTHKLQSSPTPTPPHVCMPLWSLGEDVGSFWLPWWGWQKSLVDTSLGGQEGLWMYLRGKPSRSLLSFALLMLYIPFPTAHVSGITPFAVSTSFCPSANLNFISKVLSLTHRLLYGGRLYWRSFGGVIGFLPKTLRSAVVAISQNLTGKHPTLYYN